MEATIGGVSCTKSTYLQHSTCLRDSSTSFVTGFPLKLPNLQLNFNNKKRKNDMINFVVASSIPTNSNSQNKSGRFYLNFTGFPFPLGPFLNRRTIRTEVSLSFSQFPFFCSMSFWILLNTISFNLYRSFIIKKLIISLPVLTLSACQCTSMVFLFFLWYDFPLA